MESMITKSENPDPEREEGDRSKFTIFSEIGEIFKHSAVYGIGSIASKLIGFLMIPIYTRYLSPSDYGTIELLDLVVSISGLILYDLIIESVFRFYYKYQKQSDRNLVVSTAMITHIVVSLLMAGTALLFVDEISRIVIGSEKYSSYVTLSLLSFFFLQLNAIPLGLLRVQQKSVAYILASLSNLILGLSMNIFLIVFLQWGIWGVLCSNVISNGVISLFLVPWALKSVGVRFRIDRFKEMVQYGFPLIPAGLANFSLNFSNRFFLNRYISLGELGLFALGSRFSFMISVLIIQPFLDIWDAKMFQIQNRKDAKKLYAKVLTYSALVTLVACLGLSLTIDSVLKFLVAQEFRGASKVVPILAMGYFFQIFYYNFYVGLLINNKTHWLAGIMLVSALVNLILNAIWIPRFGMTGAAWAMAGSYLFMGTLTYFISSRIFRVDYEWKRILVMLMVAVVFYIGLGRIEIGNRMVMSLGLKVVGVGAFPVVLYFIGFFDTEEKNRMRRMGHQWTNRLLRLKGQSF